MAFTRTNSIHATTAIGALLAALLFGSTSIIRSEQLQERPGDKLPSDIIDQVQVADFAADFTFELTDGKTVSMKDLRGEIVIIAFWITRSGPAIDVMPEWKKMYDTYAENGVSVYAISNEDAEEVKQFAADKGFGIPVGTGKAVFEKYELEHVPDTILFDPEGKPSWRGHPIGPEMEAAVKQLIAAHPDLVGAKDKGSFEKAKQWLVDEATLLKGYAMLKKVVARHGDNPEYGEEAKKLLADVENDETLKQKIKEAEIDAQCLQVYRKGYAAFEEENWEQTRKIWEPLIKDHPDNRWAKKAQKLLNTIEEESE